MESKITEKLKLKNTNNNEAPSKLVVMNGKSPRKQNSVEIIITESEDSDRTSKTVNPIKVKKDMKDIGNTSKDKMDNVGVDTKDKIGAKNLLKVNLMGKLSQNEGMVGKEIKGKGKKTALMRLRGSVHTIQLMSKLSRCCYDIFLKHVQCVHFNFMLFHVMSETACDYQYDLIVKKAKHVFESADPKMPMDICIVKF